MREHDSLAAIMAPQGTDSLPPDVPAEPTSAANSSAAPAMHTRRSSWHAGPAVEPIRIDVRRTAGSGAATRQVERDVHHSGAGHAYEANGSGTATGTQAPITLQRAAEIWAETPPGARRRGPAQRLPDTASVLSDAPEAVAAASTVTTAGDTSSGTANNEQRIYSSAVRVNVHWQKMMW